MDKISVFWQSEGGELIHTCFWLHGEFPKIQIDEHGLYLNGIHVCFSRSRGECKPRYEVS